MQTGAILGGCLEKATTRGRHYRTGVQRLTAMDCDTLGYTVIMVVP
jgi:hypothetical protein